VGRLQGRVAIVTGAGRGIGRAIALELAAEGAAVVLVDINAEAAYEVARELEQGGGIARMVTGDVAGAATVDAFIDAARQLGRLDVLVNNVAAFGADMHGRDNDVVTTPVEAWDRTMDVNLRAPMLACKYGIPLMLENGGGSIINISSTSGFLGDVNHVAYSTSKAGMQALTRAIATSHGKRGIRCNAIASGLVMTETAELNLAAEMRQVYADNRLIARAGRPVDIAKMAALLASDDGGYITGQTFIIDGGACAHQPWYAHAHIVHPESFAAR
jgi:3-oxoacyl-[acyl-carrier protein] reductase